MSPASPQPSAAGRLVYHQDAEASSASDTSTLEVYSDSSKELLIEASDSKGESMYVTLFEEMLNVVLNGENYLFDRGELDCFARYSKLPYRARYLFIRLCLRKSDRWIRLSDLKYQKELGDDIGTVIHELCQEKVGLGGSDAVKVKVEERDDIIDLTVDEVHHEEVKPDVFALVKTEETKPILSGTRHEPDYSVFADDEGRAAVRDLLECLRVDELREVVKEMKINKKKHDNKRDSLIDALVNSTSSQSTLPFTAVSKANKKSQNKLVQAPLTAFMLQKKTQTQQDRLRTVVTKRIGACIKLNSDVVKLFRRVNMVYFRSTLYSPTLLTDAILARCKKRNFEPVPYERTTNLWESREALLQYEAALEWEAQIDQIWGSSTGDISRSRSRSVASKTPAPRFRSEGSRSPSKRGATQEFVKDEGVHEDSADVSPRVRNARDVKAVFEEVYSLWCDVVAVKGEEVPRENGLERFHHGHVLTRIVCKGAEALGILKEYDRELDILEELLAQRRWRRARRGKWHERRALIWETHMPKGEESQRYTYQAVIEALQDDDTHIVYRPKLLRRLRKMEGKLNIPRDERIQCPACLKQADQETIQGTRVFPAVDAAGKLTTTDTKHNIATLADSKQSQLPFIQTMTQAPEPPKVQVPRTGKSIWKGRLEQEVNVETFALQHYESLGYKGFHCEGRIVTTIFGLLFWDIIFAPVLGAFETLYQVAPLDIAEETFYTARQELIQARLGDIKEGKAVELLAASYDQYSAEKRGCVGVRWNLFERQDLVEIVQCLDAAGLAAICQTVAEDYGNRTAGVPDLIIWNSNTSACKFVEVKGPGDKLQENQKLWIDVLLQAGISVEVCRVQEQDEEKSPKKSKAQLAIKQESPSVTKKRKRKATQENAPESEDEDVNYSQLDSTQDVLPVLKPAFPPSAVNAPEVHVEVLVPTPSPPKKRRRNSDQA